MAEINKSTDYTIANLIQKLQAIQEELKAPKNLVNKFGGYNYRNAESILEALKPLEKKYGVATTISDTIEEVSGRFYVVATATIWDCTSDKSISVAARAREAENKKGMDEAQITGATSSYARKYALNGLFLLDDTKDADTDEYRNESENRAKTSPATPKAKTTPKATPKAEPTPEQPEKVEVSEESKELRRKYVKYCQDNGVEISKKLSNKSTDDDFKNALAEAMAEVAAREGELPFELNV